MLADEPQHVVGDRELEVDPAPPSCAGCDAMLEVGMSDVGDHPPLEARNQPVFEAGISLGGRSDVNTICLCAFEQRVERVEEFLLRHFLAFEEMHVVHQQEVQRRCGSAAGTRTSCARESTR